MKKRLLKMRDRMVARMLRRKALRRKRRELVIREDGEGTVYLDIKDGALRAMIRHGRVDGVYEPALSRVLD